MERQHSSWEDFVNYEIDQLVATEKISFESLARIGEGYLIGRLEQRTSLDSMQRPAVIFPGLRAEPWHDPGQYEWARLLEDHYQQISVELRALIDSKAFRPHPEVETLAGSGQWNEFRLYGRGKRFDENCARCPLTDELIRSIPGATSAGSVFFAAAAAGTHIVPHCGPHNLRIRGHLGIVVPPGCEMRVGRETRAWQEGKVLVFDDSFEHEVWNRSRDTRIVLILDIWHPELTEAEILAFQHFERQLVKISTQYAMTGQLPSLP